MNNIFYYDTPIGRVGIEDDGDFITYVHFGEVKRPEALIRETPLIIKAAMELDEYFKGERDIFDLPLKLEGTEFQKKVWESLRRIPSGETRSYKQIAVEVGNPLAARAVGMANNKNKIPLFIPCHRVIGANGKLVGFEGGLEIKEKLLALEKIEIQE